MGSAVLFCILAENEWEGSLRELFFICKSVTNGVDDEITVCHCSFCRRSTVSAYSVNSRVFKQKLELLTG
ncbi:GFA family protein [Streptococcus merionis]